MVADDTRLALIADSSPARIDWLDGLRALAVGGVVIVHSAQHVPNLPDIAMKICGMGQYGVQLFFVISSLTIYFTLRSHLGRNERVRSWYIRRFFRIAPLYYAAIILYSAEHFLIRRMGWWWAAGEESGIRGVLANLTFLHGWIRNGNNSVVPGGWSIGVEMSFYIIAPWLYLFIIHRKSWPAVLAMIMPACLLATYLLRLHVLGSGTVPNNNFLYFWPLTQLPVFFAGMALVQVTRCWFYTHNPTPSAWAFSAAIVGGAALSLGAFCGTWGNRMHLLAPTLFGVGFCCLVLLARDQLKSLFANHFMMRIGGLSYSIYITHFIFLDLFRGLFMHFSVGRYLSPMAELSLLATATFTFAASSSVVTQRLIEQPGIRLGACLARRISVTQ
jgi:peptidoglycan/LPS O-acetylase OafA/YrhL